MVFLYLVSVMNLLLLRECSFVARQFGMMIMIFASYTNIVSVAIVAEAIASSFDLPTEEFIETYKGWGMYLDDLSCCGQECLTC